MKHYVRLTIGLCCTILLFSNGMSQNAMALSQRDSMLIRNLSLVQLEQFGTLLNNITHQETYPEDFEDFVHVSVNGSRRIFFNSQATIQADLDPDVPPGQEVNFREVQEVSDYLSDFRTFYASGVRNSVFLENPLVSDIKFSEALGYFYMKIKYSSRFERNHTTKNKAFPTRTRIAQFRIDQVGGKWRSFITSIRFFSPNDNDKYREANAREKAFGASKDNGDLLISIFEYRKAMDSYKDAQVQVPNDFYVNNQIDKLEIILSDIEDRKFYTLDSYNSKIISLNNNRNAEEQLPDLYFERGNMYERDRKYMEALNDYQQVVRLASRHRKAQIKIGDLELRQNHDREAIVAYTKALDLYIFPEDLSMLEKLADLEKRNGMTLEAGDHLLKALEYQERPDLYLKLGEIFELGDINRAIFNYQQAIRMNRSYVDAHWRLGRCYLRTKNYKQAGEEFRLAIEGRPRLRRDLNELIDQTFIGPANQRKKSKEIG